MKTHCPVAYAQPSAIMLKQNYALLISALLRVRRPAAIIWLISFIIVYSIEREIRWLLAHVGHEILESIPAFTDLDAAAAICGIPFVLGIRASRMHCFPDLVGIRVAMPMWFANTTATSLGARPKIPCFNQALFSALATAVPLRM